MPLVADLSPFQCTVRVAGGSRSQVGTLEARGCSSGMDQSWKESRPAAVGKCKSHLTAADAAIALLIMHEETGR